MVGVGIDISDRKQTEQALRERGRSGLLRHAAVGIALVNRDGDVPGGDAAVEAMLGTASRSSGTDHSGT